MKLFCKFGVSGLSLVVLGLVCSAPKSGYCAGEESAHAITPARIAALPKTERAAWQAYYKRSEAHLKADKAVLAAEVKAQGLTESIPAPKGDGFRYLRQKTADWLVSDEAKAMANACVSFQTPSGGWSKGVAFNSGSRRPAMHWTTQIPNWYYVGTFDNGANSGAMNGLAKIYNATKDPKYSAAFLKGLDYIFDAQFPNGGWPQNYPLGGWYHDEITYNDDAMTNVVGLLRDVASGQGDFSFVDVARRNKAKVAMEAGLKCILKTQVVQNGKLTVWCAQHDPITLEVAPARKFEVASLSGGESTNIVRFLMSIEQPSPEIKTAVKSAVEWFKSVQVNGYEMTSSLNPVGGRVFTLREYPNAGPLWGRFYELGTNRPIFVTREVKIFYNLNELDQSGPDKGYNWYVNSPQKLLENEYPKWLAKNEPFVGTVKTVNPDGTGDFTTIQAAVDSVPDRNTTPTLIQVAAGTYAERVLVPRGRNFITLRGAGKLRTDVLITGGADKTAVLKVNADDFRAENFTVENTAGQVGPQQALYGDGKRQIFENLLIKGWQDTLASWNGHLAYFHNCEVWGSVDFIYSGGTAVFEECDIVQIRDTGGPYTAPSTPKEVPYGFVFLRCRMLKGPDVKGPNTTLNRPWRDDGATAYINCFMDTHVTAKGWSEWDGREKTARCFEYGSKRLDGTPIDLSIRAPWVKILSDEEAKQYTMTNVLGGWNPRK